MIQCDSPKLYSIIVIIFLEPALDAVNCRPSISLYPHRTLSRRRHHRIRLHRLRTSIPSLDRLPCGPTLLATLLILRLILLTLTAFLPAKPEKSQTLWRRHPRDETEIRLAEHEVRFGEVDV